MGKNSMKKARPTKRIVRHKRIRAKISGTAQCPRLFVFKSNQHIYGGLADDANGRVILSISDHAKTTQKKRSKIDSARGVGEALAQAAVKAGYKRVVFDRGGYKYHGRVQALAEGARAKGLKF